VELLLLLADGRFPGGSHAHSGGLEQAVQTGAVTDVTTLEAFSKGRLTTSGLTDAWFAFHACAADFDLFELEDAYDARLLAEPLRVSSRALGRGLRRSATPAWPDAAGIVVQHHPLVLGSIVALAGGLPADAARLAVHGTLMQILAAAPKLLRLDMADAMRIAAGLTDMCDDIVAAAIARPTAPITGAPLTELRSLDHARREDRLFVS
jgi:urease accessory protein